MDNSSINVTPTSSSSIHQPSINSDRKKEGFKQQFKRLVGWGSSYNVKKQANGSLPPPLSICNTPSNASFVSTPSTPFPPTPGTLSSVAQPKVHQVNDMLEINRPVSIASKPSVVNNSSATGSTTSLTASSKILSNHSSLSSASSTSSVTSEELKAAAACPDENEADEEEEEQQQEICQEAMPVQVAEEGDIQTQYAMWMTTNAAVPTPEPPISFTAMESAKEEPQPAPPSKASSLHKKSSIISNIPSEDSTISTTDEHDLHPMSSSQEVDDLFLLVAHGVEFLTSRENSQWEEYGGYEFHPWNRPQGSFSVVRHKQRNKETLALPQQLTSNESRPKIETSSQVQDVAEIEEEEEEEKETTPPSTPQQEEESPSALAKRILGAKPEVQVPLNQSQPQQHQSVDDEVRIILKAYKLGY